MDIRLEEEGRVLRLALQHVVAGIGDPGRSSGLVNSSSSASQISATDLHVHKHLRRLQRVWIEWPIYFVTTCTVGRRAILASRDIVTILTEEWQRARARHHWAIGRYVIMPDHVHFFCRAELGAKTLSRFMQRWKEWTSKRILRELTVAGIADPGCNHSGSLWQEEFFDHLLRSSESYSQKWDYVRDNPVRARLVKNSDEWPWQGESESLML